MGPPRVARLPFNRASAKAAVVAVVTPSPSWLARESGGGAEGLEVAGAMAELAACLIQILEAQHPEVSKTTQE